MNTYYYAKTKRQYKYLVKRINKLISTNEWETLSKKQQNKFKARLKRLTSYLTSVFNKTSVIKSMGAAALVLGMGVTANAQSFNSSVQNPFNLSKGPNISIPSLADIDGDGDLDFFNIEQNSYYDVEVAYRENIGTATAANFGPVQLNPFGIATDSTGFKSSFVDIDGDGDLDMFRGTYYGNFIYYKNTGTKTAPQFSNSTNNPFNLSFQALLPMLNFADLDNDGDMDLMAGSYYGDFYYFENTGTKAAPNFAASQQNPFGLTTLGSYFSAPEFSDVDGDGDLDMLSGEEYGNFKYYKNTGSKSSPAFASVATNPFGLVGLTNEYSFIAFADLDKDGDDDIMAGDYYGNNFYFENASSIGVPEKTLSTQLNVFPNPANGIVNVSLTQELGNAEVEITSLSGQVVLLSNIESTMNATLDVSHLNSGVYILKLKANNRVGIKKLVIE
jgi:hypothetical protein